MRLLTRQPKAVLSMGIDVQVKRNPVTAQRRSQEQAVLHRYGCIIRGMPEECRRRVRCHLQFAAEPGNQLCIRLLP
ncbi:hypothetical protein D3C73_1527770 [compost metagenome]